MKWLRHAKIDLVRGHGRLAGERRLVVADKASGQTHLRARRAVAVCTGSRPALPVLQGLAEVKPWTNREAVSARTVPHRLAIIGGGVVACEMATAWNQFGTKEITLIQRGTRLIPTYESFAGDLLRASFEQKGIRVLTDATIKRAERQHDGVARLYLNDGQTFFVDQVLAATGRQPGTQDVGLETVGLKPGSWLEVDESMRVKEVSEGWLYAAGDVNRRALLTHMGKYQARVCGDVIAARANGNPQASGPEPWSQYSATADLSADRIRGEKSWNECAHS